MTTHLDASKLPQDWARALKQRGCDLNELEKLVTDLYKNSPSVLPERANVFRAFHLTKLKDVRVVILGQDPYPKRDQHAQGLAFSVPEGVPIPRSLSNIFRNLEADDAIDFRRPKAGDQTVGDLTDWAKQGVLLINTALTVGEDEAGSHKRHWKTFTNLVLKSVIEEQGHVAFLLWGNPAIKCAEDAEISEPPHKLIKSAHPRGGRSIQKRFKAVHHFSEADDFLATHGRGRVAWNLGADT
jgi:uracil-DNA glycosylase